MLTPSSLNRNLLAGLAAACLCLFAHSHAVAGHCGCQPSCNSCPAISSACACDCACDKQPNCLQKAFDAVSAALDRLFHLHSCGGREPVCDDACDAAMIEELMSPPPPTIPHHDCLEGTDHPDPAEHQKAAEPELVPPPVRLPQTEAPAEEEPKKEPGSLFDTLSNPFGDDQARLKTYRPVRPSAYLNPSVDEEYELRPVRRRELPGSHTPLNQGPDNVR